MGNFEKLLLIIFDYLEDNRLCQIVAKLISNGDIVGWFQGAMEFGPRALGNRSILADLIPLQNLKLLFQFLYNLNHYFYSPYNNKLTIFMPNL